MDRQQAGIEVVDEASQGYVGQWNQLISTTNWQKGQIIHEWRAALLRAGAPAAEYADDSWSRLVGGVSGQHVGRLRRVYERFGDVCHQYQGVYWSHFCAAQDWDDAEMWLEGAVQNHWSVSAMRRQRWETLGAAAEDEPRDQDVIASELDEDFVVVETASGDRSLPQDLVADDYTAAARSPAGPDFGDEDTERDESGSASKGDRASAAPRSQTADPVRPFAELPELPEDLALPFEAFQLAILRHKAQEWREVALADVLTALDALKSLALAPAV